MTRANATTVKAAIGGTFPAGWTSTTVNTQCAYADADIDNFCGPDTVSQTSTEAIGIAIDVVMRRMSRVDAFTRRVGSSSADGVVYPDWIILTDDIKDRLQSLMAGTSSIEPLVVMFE